MKLAIGADHGGYRLKEELKQTLVELGHDYVDFGCAEGERVDYPDIALPAAQAVVSGRCDKGILICGTGIGMSLAANKVPGIRAALVHCTFTAELAAQHNNANVLVLGGRLLAAPLAAQMVKVWLSTAYDPRHDCRLRKLEQLEDRFAGVRRS